MDTSPPLLTPDYDPLVVGISFLIATFASYVALDLAKRVRTNDAHIARAWWIGGSVAMGTGIWSMHFVGMLAASLPFAVGYGYATTAGSWLAAVGASAVALRTASRQQLNAVRLVAGSLAMGGGISAMHYAGMASLDLAPGIQWNWLLVGTSIAIAAGASAAALVLFFGLQRFAGARARQWQIVAALVMAAAICGMHYTGMAAAGFAADSICGNADRLRGDSMAFMVTAAATLLLGLTMFTSMIDARLQSKAERLADALRDANTELQQIAFRDPLTGLPNRLLFEDRLDVAVQRCWRDGATLGVLFIDLDGFKPINDALGHHVGDAVLRAVGQRITGHLRGTDTVARVGGDEFVILLEGELDATSVAQTAQRIIDAVCAPMVEDGNEVRVGCSVGIAMYPSDGPREHLLANADAAMYAAKRANGACYAFFEPHMNAGVREQLELRRDLRHALARNEFELHYQPKVHAGRGVVTGLEATVRWRHPQRGLLGPEVFTPLIARSGQIGPLGDWMVEEACRQMGAWRQGGLRMRVALHLSSHQLRQSDLPARVEAAIARHGIAPEQLTFEVSEAVALADIDTSLEVLRALGRIGTRLSIDDFGNGCASLSWLRRVRAGELKIDRSFIDDLGHSEDARAIVEAVVRLAHVLELKVVAEGVETPAQRRILSDLQCDELQGMSVARPMPAAALSAQAGARHGASLEFSNSTFLDRPYVG